MFAFASHLIVLKLVYVVEKTNLTIPGQDKTLSLSHDKLSLAASVQNMMLASELDISNVRRATSHLVCKISYYYCSLGFP